MKEKLNSFIKEKLDALKLKKVHFDKVQVKSDHVVISIYGGENGPGRWQDYLGQIDTIVRAFKGSYVVDIQNDCPDDVWYLRLGWRMNDEIRTLIPFDVSDFGKTQSGWWLIKIGKEDYIYVVDGMVSCYLDEDGAIKEVQSMKIGDAKNIKTGETIMVYRKCETQCDALSMEASGELIRLGIPYSYATAHCVFDAPYRTAGVGIGTIFSLGDLLRILPPVVTINVKEEYVQAKLLIATVGNNTKGYKYTVGYMPELKTGQNTPRMIVARCSSQLVDALARLVKWCISEGHIKPATQEIAVTTSSTIGIYCDECCKADIKSDKE